MNIVHVIPDLSPLSGGPVSAVCGMAEAEKQLGHTVTVVSTDIGLTEPPLFDGVVTKMYPCSFAGWRWSRAMARELPQIIKQSDIVHIHTVWEFPTWLAAKICAKLDKPYILRPCGMLDQWSLSQSAWKKKAYLSLLAASVIRNASALHFTSEDELASSLVIGRKNRGFVTPNGLPEAAIENLPDPRVFARRFPCLTDKRIVLFLSRLHYKKQPDVAIKAFHKVCGIDDRLSLVMAGPAEPDYLVELQKIVSDLGLTNRVVFTGMLQGTAVQEAYRAAEIFLLPSLQENFGIAVAEAMAASCPVIVSKQVNLATDILEASAGIVCKSDIESTALSMERLIDDDELRVKMGENGRHLVQDKFTWRIVARDLLKVYDDVVLAQRNSTAWRA